MIGHSWGGHLLLHLLAVTPTRVGAALAVDPLGAVGDGGYAAFEVELMRRLPEDTVARLKELDAIEATRPLTTAERLEAMEIAWPGYFSSLEVAQPIPQSGHAPSDESWASIRAELPALAERLRGCTVPIRFVHGALDPLPVTASTDIAERAGRDRGRASGQRSLSLARGPRLRAPQPRPAARYGWLSHIQCRCHGSGIRPHQPRCPASVGPVPERPPCGWHGRPGTGTPERPWNAGSCR